MKVSYVISSSAPNRLLDVLVGALHPDPVTYSVVVLDDGRGEHADSLRARGVEVVGLDAPGIRDLPVAVLRLRRALVRLAPDVVHANLLWPSAAVEVARRTVRPRIPSVVARHHNRNHHLQGKPLHRRLDTWTGRHADAVLAVSTAVARTLVELDGVPAERVVVVENGMDWTTVVADEAGTARWRERFAGRRLLVAAGRLDFQKDYPTLLSAVAGVRRDHPDVLLAVAHQNVPPQVVAALRALVGRLGLDDHVELLGPVSDMFDLMSAAEAFVQSSVDESFGQTLLEAMGLGVPLVATTPGGALDVVDRWYEPIAAGDSGGLARRISAVLDDPESARRRAAALAPEARAAFDGRRMAEGTLALYRRVAGIPSYR